ncbi:MULTISPECIES: hypothetical protein [unclassified Nitrospina]|uniref:hypothetical protein n=1 Tax=unclassified Nitrospina TaxID=2638683 RepID=UPI003F98A438
MVAVAAAKVGDTHANNTYPTKFIQKYLAIQTHVLDSVYKYEVKNCPCSPVPAFAQLTKRIQRVVGWKGNIEFDTSRPDSNPRLLLDSSRIRALGWSAKVPLEDGLRIAYDWCTRTQVR